MRKRLTLAFVILMLILGGLAYVARSWTIQNEVRDQHNAALHREAKALATVIAEREQLGGRIDAAFLRPYVGERVAVRLHPASGSDVVVHGPGFTGSDDPTEHDGNLWAAAPVSGDGFLVLSETSSVVRQAVYHGRLSLVLLILLVGLTAGLVGFAVATWLAGPFRQLAVAAAALGRGRFQLELPRTRIPEAREIAGALEASARKLEDQLAREREFAERASHVLRTPLTGLRLELEDIALHDGLSAETSAALVRCVAKVDRLDAVTGELVSLARRGALVEEAAIPLRDLATQIAQRWADELATRDRVLTAAVDGDVETTYTPGPVEQLMESLLVDVGHRTSGAVRLVYEAGAGGLLRIAVTAEGGSEKKREESTAPLERARAIALALGGRLDGESAQTGLEVRLPRR